MAPKKQVVQVDSNLNADEPPTKMARTEEPAAKAEEDVEVEKDSKADSRKVQSEAVNIDIRDSTLNVVPTCGGKVLMALSDAGLQYLVAGARSNVGVKKGRYMFEIRVIEVLYPALMGRVSNLQVNMMPKQQCRIGFSKQGSSLFLGETADSVCFDADGLFYANKIKTSVSEPFIRDNVMGVLLNLDPTSANCNTISLFKDGRRVAKPQALPEELKGQALFPHISFRNVTVQMHFGPEPMAALPFKCRMIQDAAQADAVAVPAPDEDKKFEVVFPVGLPDEGTFDWLDGFLEKHPDYVELSDRKIIDWAVNSGLVKPKAASLKHCNDKPLLSFGVQALDELTPRKLLYTIAPLMPRNYIVMEVKSNLVKLERSTLLSRFTYPQYRKVAIVVAGEPPEEYKKRVHAVVLSEKQEKSDSEWKVRQVELERKKVIEAKQKELMEQRKAFEAVKKAADEALKAVLAEATKKAEEAAKEVKKAAKEAAKAAKEAAKEAAKAAGEEVEEEAEEAEEEEDVKMEEEEKKEEVVAEPKEDVKMEEVKEEPEEETEAPKAELDEEESKLWFLPRPVTDLDAATFNSTFTEFSLPEKDEDFHEIRYEWHNETETKEYMKSWMQAKKITTRVEELNPSEWFVQKLAEWQKVNQEWQLNQKQFCQDPLKRQASLVRAQREKLYAEKQVTDKRKAEGGEEEPAKTEVKDETAEQTPEEVAAAAAAAEQSPEEAVAAAEQAAAAAAGGNDLDGFVPTDLLNVEDINDVGEGEPMYANFAFEDWSLMNLRFELSLLVRSFALDVTDPERCGAHESHLPYYYNRYFRKPLNTKFFGVNTCLELLDLVKDTVVVKDNSIVNLSDGVDDEKLANLDILARLTEASRCERQRRIDAGDESARLKFQVLGAKGAGWNANAGAAGGMQKGGFGGGWGQQQAAGAWAMQQKGYGGGFKGAMGGKGWGGQQGYW